MTVNRLPAMYPFPEFTEVGGLICYATNFDDLYQRAADYVHKILRGAAPGELPVQQKTGSLATSPQLQGVRNEAAGVVQRR